MSDVYLLCAQRNERIKYGHFQEMVTIFANGYYGFSDFSVTMLHNEQ